MRLNRRFTLWILTAVLAASPAFAKANFSGDWKLNAAKSDFGQMPAPSSMTNKITHEDPKLKVMTKMSSERGDFEMEAAYSTDGKETTNSFRDNPMKSVAKWDGETLSIETKASFNGNDFTMQDKWTLSGDGKTMTMKRRFVSSQGEGEQTMVMEKQ